MLESHNLVDRSNILLQQLFNRLRADNTLEESLFKTQLQLEQEKRSVTSKEPWLLQLNRIRESAALRLTLLGHSDTVVDCSFSYDGSKMVSDSQDGTLKVWDVVAGREIKTLKGHRDILLSTSFYPDAKYIASAAGDDDRWSLRVWNVEIEDWSILDGHTDSVTWDCFSPDGKRVVSVYGKTLNAWDTKWGQELKVIGTHAGKITLIEFSPDSNRIVTADLDRKIRVWDIDQEKKIFDLMGHSGWIAACSFSPDGTHLASAGGRYLKIWDLSTGKEQAAFPLEGKPTSLAYGPSKNLICVGDEGGYINILSLVGV